MAGVAYSIVALVQKLRATSGTLKEPQRHDLLEVVEDRYGRSSSVVTSQLPISKWHEWIGDPSLADAILDRIVNNAYKFDLKGNSRRREKTDTTN